MEFYNDAYDFLKGMAKESQKHIPLNEGDYIKDDVIYCGKCNTPKGRFRKFAGEILTTMFMCKCLEALAETEEAEEARFREMERIETAKRICFPDPAMRNRCFENDDRSNEHLSEIAHNFVDHFDEMKADGMGLLLYGPVGTGKSFIAACIANALIERGVDCHMSNFTRVSNILWGSEDKQGYLDRLNSHTLLILDDIGAERKTEYMQGQVFDIIDARERARKPLIVTSNLTAEELKHPSDQQNQRIFSRLFGLCVPVEVTGADKRKENLASGMDKYKKLLNI